MEEPEQKRLRRIGDYLEDEIARAEDFPIEELARHKSAMIHMLQFLSIEEAYSVSLLSRRIYEWFQRNDIWYALAVKRLSPARLAQCEAWVEQVKPKGARVNYLWLLLADMVMTNISNPRQYLIRYFIDITNDVRIMIRNSYISALPYWTVLTVGTRGFVYWEVDDMRMRFEIPAELIPATNKRIAAGLFKFIYNALANFSTARLRTHLHRDVGIRSKLNNPI